MKLRQILIWGCATFFILLILALVFYKERTILNDIAFHIFYFAKNDGFTIQNNRFGAVFTQIFGVAAIKADAPLTTVMLCYSAGFVIYNLFVFLLIGLWLKNRELLLIMLLWPILFMSHTFYWMLSELNQGISFMLLFFAAYLHYKKKTVNTVWKNVLLFLLLLLSSGFHPLLFIPVTYVCLFYIFQTGNYRSIESRNLLVVAVIYFVLVFAKSLLVSVSGYGYEAGTLGGLKNFIRFFPDYFTIESNRDFLINCLRLYYFIPILLFFVIRHYYRTGSKQKLWLVAISFFGYLLLINVCYHANAPAYYIENMYLPLSIILLFPFVYDVLPTWKPLYGRLIVIFILFTGVLRIYFIHQPYTAHYNWQKNYLLRNPGKKLLVENTLVPMDTLFDTWATPYEFWLLSTSETGRSASILFTDSIERYFYHLPENKSFFTRIDIRYPYDELPLPYFNFTDTSRYTVRRAD